MKNLDDLRARGRDPLAIFRLDACLAIDPAWLARAAGGDALGFWDDDPADPAHPPYAVANGVAIYEIEGPLTQRGWMCWQGYDSVARDLDVALGDTRVRAVLLRINSPGGMAAGCFEGARAMRAAVERSGKRVVAVADEMAFSAAYALACVADEIVVPEPAGVGSVGVITSLESYARALADQGVDVRVLTSGREKADGHPDIPLAEGAVERAQARVDELAGMFHRWVAARRGMTPDGVRALEAGVRYGATAVAAGLADRVESYAAALARLQAAVAPPPTSGRLRGGASTTTPRGAAPRSTETMDAIHTLLGLPAEATDAQLLERATHLAALDRDARALTATADTEAARGALRVLAERAAQADADAAALANERATRLRDERTALKRHAVKAAVLTPHDVDTDGAGAEVDWLADMSNASLKSYVERKERAGHRVVPEGEVKPPVAPRTDEAQLPVDVAALTAKATEQGWATLTPGEKHAIRAHSKALADRLRKQA